MNARRLCLGALVVAALGSLTQACNSGKRDGQPNYSPGSGGGGGTVAGLALSQPTPPPAAALVGAGVQHPILPFRIVSQNATGVVNVTAITLTASGTIDEPLNIVSVSVFRDANANGLRDAGEQLLGSRGPAPAAFTVDDGTCTISLGAGLPINPGQTVDLVVTATTAQPAGDRTDAVIPGTTIVFSLAGSSGGLTTTTFVSGGTVGITGAPLNGTSVTLGIHPHLLITEVHAEDGEEFIELFNPTGASVDLTNFHLTDFTQDSASPTQFYWLLPTGGGFGPAPGGASNTTDDFSVRFPAGATIDPGEFQVIAVDGDDFAIAFPGVTPTYALRDPGAATAMLAWDGVATTFNFVGPTAGPNVSLADTGEPIFLFTWDGSANPVPDLITDVDVFGWGAVDGSGFNPMVDKTGESCDAFVGAGTPTAFAAETGLVTQEANRVPVPGAGDSMHRDSYLEALEVSTAGNGVGGHDETSEDWGTNFVADTPTPGAP